MSKYKSLKDHVYEYISEQINNGNLKPKEKINEKEISEKLDISRTPIREGLNQLVNEGLLDKKPRKGFIVKEVKEKTVKEVYQIIGVLESLAISLSWENLNDKDIKEMKKLVDKMDIAIKYDDYKEYYELQSKFHKIYIENSNNDKLLEILNSLKKIFIKKNYYKENDNSNIKNALFKTNNEHKKMIELIEDNKKEELQEYLKKVHWSNEFAKMDSFES